jgi:hypothetical protein
METITKAEFDNAKTDRRVEILNKVLKGEVKIVEDDFLTGFFNNLTNV